MARFSLRSTLLAGAFALVAAPSLAQVMEVAIDQSPAGLDPHIVTSFTCARLGAATRANAPASNVERSGNLAMTDPSWTSLVLRKGRPV